MITQKRLPPLGWFLISLWHQPGDGALRDFKAEFEKFPMDSRCPEGIGVAHGSDQLPNLSTHWRTSWSFYLTIHSNYLDVSGETGEIQCLMDAEVLTGLRTATTSAMVADLVGKSGGRVMAVFGTGVQAWFHVEVFTKLFSIGEVLVFGRTPERSEEFANGVERQLRTPARRAVISELKRADLVCTCTTNPNPVFEYKDIRPGVHITAVGSYRPNTRELGTGVIKNSTVIVDTYEGALNEAGDIVIPIQEGAITRDHLYASIAELISEAKPAPDEDRRMTVFKSLGMALEDLVAADLAYRKAVERGTGKEVTL